MSAGKPAWKDKWRALFDMKAARNVAQGTTSESTTTDRNGALAAGTIYRQMQEASYHQQQRWMMEKMYQEQLDFLNHYRVTRLVQDRWYDGLVNIPSQYQNPCRVVLDGMGEQTISPSPITTKTETSSVSKDETLETVDLSILIGDRLTTSSPSLEKNQSVMDW